MTMIENSFGFLRKNILDLVIICSVGIILTVLVEPHIAETSNQTEAMKNISITDFFRWLGVVIINTFIVGCLCFYTHNQVHFKQAISPIESFKIILVKSVRVLKASIAYISIVYGPALLAFGYVMTQDFDSSNPNFLETILVVIACMLTIYLSFKLFFTVYVYLLENKTILQAYKTSWQLSKDVILSIVLGLMFIAAIQLILFVIVEMLIQPQIEGVAYLGLIITTIVETFGLLVTTLFTYHLYYHQHTR